MDFLKKLPDKIKCFIHNPIMQKGNIIIVAACLIMLIALPVSIKSLIHKPVPAFKGFMQIDRGSESLETSVAKTDRFVRLTILRELEVEEYAKIPGMFLTHEDVPRNENGHRMKTIDGYYYATLEDIIPDDGIPLNCFFEAQITYDYETDKKVNEKIIIPSLGTHQYQDRGNPIYQPGDEHVLLLMKLWSPDGPLYGIKITAKNLYLSDTSLLRNFLTYQWTLAKKFV